MTSASAGSADAQSAGRQRYVVAVVGAGPSGIYAAEALSHQTDVEIEVAVIDRLPVPFGLVRYGVAPDHPSIRSIRNTLERTLEKSGVRFFGDVLIGRDLTVGELRNSVDAVVYAWGAGTSRRLGIDGEDAVGSMSAPDFVAWYCGHPDVHPDGPAPSLDHGELAGLLTGAREAVVVGAGNVALDVTRILIKHAEELAGTDMAEGVLDVLGDKHITDVHLLSRRGPAQTQMTTKELRELGVIDDCDIYVYPPDLDWRAEAIGGEGTAGGLGKVAARNVAVFSQWAQGSRQSGGSRRIHLHFWTRPTVIEESEGRVTGVRVVDNRPGYDGSARLDAQLVVRSIGYRGLELAGVSFDTDTGRVPHVEGRVLAETPAGKPPEFSVGEYVTGWIKRGPTGVIGTNKSDAVETVHSLLEDIADGDIAPRHPRGLEDLAALLHGRGIQPLELQAWHRIDAAEIDLGQTLGRERTTLARRSELLDAARNNGGDDRPGGP